MDVFVATKNAGKVRELQAIFATHGWTVRTYADYADVVEGAESYEINAALKARKLYEQLRDDGLNAGVLGDDSGLEVAALDGRPGVLSARYGGPNATWHQRRSLLLSELNGNDDRRAAFVCALHFISLDGVETSVLRRLHGEIAVADRGCAGFSYDPVFYYSPLSATFGELDEKVKNGVSHRALAVRALVATIETKAADTEMQNVHGDGT